MEKNSKKDTERFGRSIQLGTGKIIEKAGQEIDKTAKAVSSIKQQQSLQDAALSPIEKLVNGDFDEEHYASLSLIENKDNSGTMEGNSIQELNSNVIADTPLLAGSSYNEESGVSELGINTQLSDPEVNSDTEQFIAEESSVTQTEAVKTENLGIQTSENSSKDEEILNESSQKISPPCSALNEIKTLSSDVKPENIDGDVRNREESLSSAIQTLALSPVQDAIIHSEEDIEEIEEIKEEALNKSNVLSFLNRHTFDFHADQGKLSKAATVIGKTASGTGKMVKKGANVSRKISKAIDGEDATGFNMLNSELQRKEAKAGKWIATKAGKAGIKETKKIAKSSQTLIKSSVRMGRSATKQIGSFLKKITVQIFSAIKLAVTSMFQLLAPFLPAILGGAVIFGLIIILLVAISGAANPCGQYTEIKPCDLGNSTKDIAWANQRWNRSSEQYEIFNCDEGGCSPSTSPKEGETDYGTLKKDSLGFYYIEENGIKYYCNAMASYYTSKIGEKFRITTDEGNTFNIIIADQKADQHTHAGNNDSNGHCLSASGGMLEFYVDHHSYVGGTMNQNFDDEHPFKGAVTKIEKMSSAVGCPNGSLGGEPNFSNSEAWKSPNNPYAPTFYGQCTWFAWGRFYEIYGYSPGFTGNGYECVSQLLAAHPDKFEFGMSPKVGAVGSADRAHNHVFIVTGVEGDKITVQEGNLNGATDSWEVAINDWHTTTYTMSGLRSAYGNVVFANPK